MLLQTVKGRHPFQHLPAAEACERTIGGYGHGLCTPEDFTYDNRRSNRAPFHARDNVQSFYLSAI